MGGHSTCFWRKFYFECIIFLSSWLHYAIQKHELCLTKEKEVMVWHTLHKETKLIILIQKLQKANYFI